MNVARWMGLGILVAVIAGSSIAMAASGPPAPDPAKPAGVQECLQCHGQPGKEVVRDGQHISLYVNADTYGQSVHGILSCARCHPQATEDHIKNPDKPLGLPTDDRELRKEISAECVKCHAGVFDRSYKLSFHGIATQNGDLRAATCVDCHGTHNIFPKEDARSAVNKANVAQTCAQCHKNAPPSFADRTEHYVIMDKKDGGIYNIIWKGFVALILFDVMKDGPIVMFDLLKRCQRILGLGKEHEHEDGKEAGK